MPGNSQETVEATSLAVLVDEHLYNYDSVRHKNMSVANSLRAAAARRLFGVRPAVRGNHVASDVLLDAVVTYGTAERCTLFAYASNNNALLSRFHSHLQRRNGEYLEIIPLSGILQDRVGDRKISTWFNPMPHCSVNGGVEVSYRVRERHGGVYPITTLIHGLNSHAQLYSVFVRLLLESTLSCDSLICTSRASYVALVNLLEATAERFHSKLDMKLKYGGRVDVVPLCVNANHFRPSDVNGKLRTRKTLGVSPEAVVIVTLGRLSAMTKADLLPFCETLRALVGRRGGSRVHWLITGTEDPGYSKVIRQRAQDLGVSNNVSIILNPSDTDKIELLRASDIFLLLSDTVDESFGLAPIEAMACGIPQVVADWSGFRDTVVQGVTGFLVPTYWAECHGDLGSASAIGSPLADFVQVGQSTAADLRRAQEYLECLIDRKDMRLEMGRRSRERALMEYDGAVVAGKYEQLWSELRAVASTLSFSRVSGGIDHIDYDRTFRHYATKVLDDETLLQPTDIAKARGAEAILSQVVSLPEFVDRRLAAAVMQAMVCDERTVRMGELLSKICSDTHSSPWHARRQLMWLIKYGYVELRKTK